MNTLNILLQSQPGGGGGMMQLLFLVLIIVVFYFFMIRPQMRKAKLERNFREGVKKGDRIVTIGGIHCRILDVEATTFMVEIDNNVKVRLEKNAVAVDATKALNTQK